MLDPSDIDAVATAVVNKLTSPDAVALLANGLASYIQLDDNASLANETPYLAQTIANTVRATLVAQPIPVTLAGTVG